eukprot:scaffold63452_cov65-Phaeocystis_antarctica.AAC.1
MPTAPHRVPGRRWAEALQSSELAAGPGNEASGRSRKGRRSHAACGHVAPCTAWRVKDAPQGGRVPG